MADCARSHFRRESLSEKKPLVVLLHGVLRTHVGMLLLERALRKAGFETWNRSYPWRGKTLEEIADGLAVRLEKFKDREIDFVTHSYGGIVARAYLARHQPRNVRRMVMLGPPNQGAWLAEKAANHVALRHLFEALYGKAAPTLRASAIRRLPPPSCEFAVIAGGRGKALGYSPLLPGDNDGSVRVAETKLRGMKAFARVPHGHTFLMNGKDSIRLTIRFLTSGQF